MAWQSRWEQMRSTRLSRDSAGALLGGLIVGLLLGLLIGWVWWPVEWQGPTTGATTATTGAGATGAAGTLASAPLGSQFETPEAKALYLGAVADAFVYAGAAGETDAAAVAAQRLAALGGDLRAAFNNAIDFYRAQAGGAVRANNLATLALAVGIPVDANAAGTNAAGGQAGAAAADNSAAGAAVESNAGGITTGVTASATTGGSSNWPLILFLALLMIAGGLFILWLIRQQQTRPAGGGFAQDEADEIETRTTTTFERGTLNSARPSLTPAASVRSSVDRPQATQAGGFDADELEEFNAASVARYTDIDASTIDEEENEDQSSAQRAGRRTLAGAYTWVDDDGQDDEGEGGDVEEGDEEHGDNGGAGSRFAGQSAAQPGERQAPSGFVTSVGAAPPFRGAQPGAQPASAPRQPTLQPPTPSRYDQYTPVEGYTATYYQGRVDFDYTKSVPKADNSGYDGEYGIGIPDSGLLDSIDLEKVVALTVYLFDKSDETQPITVSRLLLSTYADNHRAQFERDEEGETKRLPPIVAQPNTNFQLEGHALLLDCLIKQVEYTAEGYFRSATIEVVLKRRG